MKQIILITGGARSGKSSYAERLALSLTPHPVYMATARIWDEEFAARVAYHKAHRGPCWCNIGGERTEPPFRSGTRGAHRLCYPVVHQFLL